MERMAWLQMELLSPLYEDVQQGGIFPDSKYFVDAVPLFPVETILAAYSEAKMRPGFSLKEFITQHFQLPDPPDETYRSGNKPIREHLDSLWNVLLRTPGNGGGTLIPLPHPYIVPGGRFREVYYWDSYFTMLGLQVSGRIDIMENMVRNFAAQIDTLGFIPNGNRSYYLGRSQPPFFSLMVELLAQSKGNDILLQYQKQLEKEYAFWMQGAEQVSTATPAERRVVKMPDGSLLNRYWDSFDTPRPEAYAEDLHLAMHSGRNHSELCRHIRAAAESGWDFSSRWFEDPMDMATIQTTDIIPIDLNCLLLHLEELLASLYLHQHTDQYHEMLERVDNRRQALETYCWQEKDSFYMDYNWRKQITTGRITAAGLFPFFFGYAPVEYASSVALQTEEKLLRQGGLITTPLATGQQWDAPNGWAPLQWIGYYGFSHPAYQQTALAEKIREAWIQTCEKIYAATGKMMEKYNVTDTDNLAGGGEYPNQDGFGWTNGVYLKLASLG
jgi:alpha,alpha-trehalase